MGVWVVMGVDFPIRNPAFGIGRHRLETVLHKRQTECTEASFLFERAAVIIEFHHSHYSFAVLDVRKAVVAVQLLGDLFEHVFVAIHG